MNEAYYPIFIKGSALCSLVIGGGIVAERKITVLLDKGAKVTVVSPRISSSLAALAQAAQITWISDRYHSRYLKNIQLVIAATNECDTNKQVFVDAKNAGILVNSVDDPQHCSCIVPATFTKGKLSVAVSTSGAAPEFASRIKNEIKDFIPDEYEILLDELFSLRPQIKALPPERKELFWKKALSLDISNIKIKADSIAQLVRNTLSEATQQNSPSPSTITG